MYWGTSVNILIMTKKNHLISCENWSYWSYSLSTYYTGALLLSIEYRHIFWQICVQIKWHTTLCLPPHNVYLLSVFFATLIVCFLFMCMLCVCVYMCPQSKEMSAIICAVYVYMWLCFWAEKCRDLLVFSGSKWGKRDNEQFFTN